ncbi:MAG: hypothetical protein GXO35_05115 [Gammaproteobacteria bacterium]|nr:hypothetical protein [Gammaproteobacteria bacterium]
MANARRYFRYNVMIPMHFEAVDRYGHYLGAARNRLILPDEEMRLQIVSGQLSDCLDKLFDAGSNAHEVFYVLKHRLDYMSWLLQYLIESNDPRRAGDYQFRLKADHKFCPPKCQTGSKIAPLILGVYKAIDACITELHSVVDNSIEGNIFLYPAPLQSEFTSEAYVANLDKLADAGVLPAQFLDLMVNKLQIHTTVLNRLKQAYHKRSHPNNWPLYQVNLSAGGFSVDTRDEYALFSRLEVFMNLKGDTMICRAKVVSRGEDDVAGAHKLGVEFELLTGEEVRKISLFLQHKELRDAMSVVALSH